MASWIKKKINNDDINYFKYEFSNKIEIGRGGFGIVYKADWNFRGMDKAALKILINNGSSIDAKKLEEFIKELKFIRSFNYHPNINHFAGHSKNILVNGDKENRTLMIVDFGLFKVLTEKPSPDSKQGIGMLEYTDPMFFKSNNSNFIRDKKSDIYSLGILLWEITSGHPPYQDIDQIFLSSKIGKGFREKPIKGTPSNYSDLYERCWNDDPNQRPDIDEVYVILIKLQHPKKRAKESSLHDENISSSLVFNFFKLNLNDNIIDENELNNALKEIKEGYIKNNDTGPTKWFDFEHILKKHKPQSNHIFNHLENNPNTQR
ncbi:kinase-like domain-containing protein [Glomus cerebriforme]|uniref:Kinase-like domain-containing protein n=1 Tax=Glomus cerebriforme TaxID=658196 RepID=A0A397SQF1_9GLOM|nr:kinase-like domain-containing protein [Glomus cerebriforme]